MKLSDLVGKQIVRTEHIKGDWDSDERVELTMNDGMILTVGTSEWLHVSINGESIEDANQS